MLTINTIPTYAGDSYILKRVSLRGEPSQAELTTA